MPSSTPADVRQFDHWAAVDPMATTIVDCAQNLIATGAIG
jgi:hypothetical protein